MYSFDSYFFIRCTYQTWFIPSGVKGDLVLPRMVRCYLLPFMFRSTIALISLCSSHSLYSSLQEGFLLRGVRLLNRTVSDGLMRLTEGCQSPAAWGRKSCHLVPLRQRVFPGACGVGVEWRQFADPWLCGRMSPLPCLGSLGSGGRRSLRQG